MNIYDLKVGTKIIRIKDGVAGSITVVHPPKNFRYRWYTAIMNDGKRHYIRTWEFGVRFNIKEINMRSISKYVIGNKDKTKFLSQKDVDYGTGFCLGLGGALQFSEYVADEIINLNKYTKLYLDNDFKYKYKITLTLEE